MERTTNCVVDGALGIPSNLKVDFLFRYIFSLLFAAGIRLLCQTNNLIFVSWFTGILSCLDEVTFVRPCPTDKLSTIRSIKRPF